MKPLPLNPYIAGNPISDPQRFVGREDVFRDVMKVFRHPQENAIVLYGQRRIGKTSVLLQLEKQLAAGGEFTPVYFDLQDKAAKPLSEVLYELAQRVVIKTGQAAIDRVNFDDTGKYFHKNFIPVAVNAAAKSGVVLLFDEFDVLDNTKQNQAGEAFFPYLRDWMAEAQRVKFVFVIGRRPEDLSIDTMSTFKAVRSKRVSLFERSDAEALISQSKRDSSLVWDETAVKRVWNWAQGHPYLTQLLCSAIWENAYDTNSSTAPRVEAANVDAAIDKTLQQGANAFHWIWSGLPPAERVVMAAMAEAGDVVITQKQLVEILRRSGVRLIVRELELAPETLAEWELLRPDKNGYRFVVPLLRRWVATNRPLRRVKEELDRLDPLSENLFQTGQSFYSLGQPAEAESQLRQALRINPNHLKSRLLLGRILLENEKPLESVDVLEEAFRYDEGAARADLIKALLALVDGQAETEQLATYDRVLTIDRDQPLARERRQAIWLRRGETALQQDDLETAITAFKTAGDATRSAQVQLLQRKRQLGTQIEAAAQQESKENWENVITIYENLLREFPDEGEWQTKLQNAKTHARLAKLYSEALGVLETGNSENAQRLLAEVIAQQPDYKEAARHLLRATAKARLLKLWNPIDYLRLLWWALIKPKTLKAYKAELDNNGRKRLEYQGGWLASSLTWWPMVAWIAWPWFIGSVNEPNSWPIFFLGLLWLFTGLHIYLQDSEDFFIPLILFSSIFHGFMVINKPGIFPIKPAFASDPTVLIWGGTFIVLRTVAVIVAIRSIKGNIINEVACSVSASVGSIVGAVLGSPSALWMIVGIMVGVLTGWIGGFILGDNISKKLNKT